MVVYLPRKKWILIFFIVLGSIIIGLGIFAWIIGGLDWISISAFIAGGSITIQCSILLNRLIREDDDPYGDS